MTLLFLDDDDAARAPLAAGLARMLAELFDIDASAYSAGMRPSHVRAEVRKVLREVGAPIDGIHAKPLMAVPLDEVTLVVRLAPGLSFRLPADVPCLDWHLPDPCCAPPAERDDAYRATRDELLRRLRLHLCGAG
ncbi:MAG: hypothetical protein EXR69_01455 [Myxococcales bacterium]|nr:hypothetical protein [Myxococcales bacterium]